MNKATFIVLAALIQLSQTLPAADLAPGLVGHWRFDGCDGKTVTDLSGSGNDGAICDGVIRKEKNTVSLELDGLEGHVLVDLKTPLGLRTNITTVLWVRASRLRANTVFFGIPNSNPGSSILHGRCSTKHHLHPERWRRGLFPLPGGLVHLGVLHLSGAENLLAPGPLNHGNP